MCIVSSAMSQAVAVVGYKTFPSVSKQQIYDAYALDSKEIRGVRFVLFDYSENLDFRRLFYEGIGFTMPDLKRKWLKAQLTGSGVLPLTVRTYDDMIQRISTIPNSIGFIPLDKVTDKVKVLFVLN